MRNGVREVVELPLSANSLHEAIDRILSQQRESSREEGKILSFISCKGGSGTTFIADNLAYALASVSNKKVLLIDLNLQFGDAALFLSDAQPSMTLADLCRQIHRLDAALLDSSLIHVTPSFGILPASGEPDPYDTIRPEQIDAILHLARQEYDFVFIDLGRQINGIVIRALYIISLSLDCFKSNFKSTISPSKSCILSSKSIFNNRLRNHKWYTCNMFYDYHDYHKSSLLEPSSFLCVQTP